MKKVKELSGSSIHKNLPETGITHNFVTTTFTTPTYCAKCSDFLWGMTKQGEKCTVCEYPVHHKCSKLVGSNCPGEKKSTPRRGTIVELKNEIPAPTRTPSLLSVTSQESGGATNSKPNWYAFNRKQFYTPKEIQDGVETLDPSRKASWTTQSYSDMDCFKRRTEAITFCKEAKILLVDDYFFEENSPFDNPLPLRACLLLLKNPVQALRYTEKKTHKITLEVSPDDTDLILKRKKNSDHLATFGLHTVVELRIGEKTPTFLGMLKSKSSNEEAERCPSRFSLVFEDETILDLELVDPNFVAPWLYGLREVCSHLKENQANLLIQKAWTVKTTEKLTFAGVIEMLKKSNSFNINPTVIDLLNKRFLELVGDEKSTIGYEQYLLMMKVLHERQEFRELFNRYSIDKKVITKAELSSFLKNDQKEENPEEVANELFSMVKKADSITCEDFEKIMSSEFNSAFRPSCRKVYQDMTQPIHNYFIASSHNTYLDGNQLNSNSTAQRYIDVLKAGCRCVELDIWDGDDGQPIIYHGFTLTSKMKFEEAVKAIRDYAFFSSDYPVILSFENHCSVEQQTVMANILVKHLGDMLLLPTSHDPSMKFYYSPEALKRKVIIKGKTLAPAGRRGDQQDEDFEETPEQVQERLQMELGAEKVPEKAPEKTADVKKGPKISKELSDITAMKAVHFPGTDKASELCPWEICSISEETLAKLVAKDEAQFLKYHARGLTRVYPKGSRVKSDNYNPMTCGWSGGCQVVALNYQTWDIETYLNDGFFQDNGGCGYLLKPKIFRDENTSFDPARCGRPAPENNIKTLSVTIISGWSLSSGSLDPSVSVSIAGLRIDQTTEESTPRVLNNGFNPVWNCQFKFSLVMQQIAILLLIVNDEKKGRIGWRALPVECLRQGYRIVELNDPTNGKPLPRAKLLCHFAFSDIFTKTRPSLHEFAKEGSVDSLKKELRIRPVDFLAENDQTALHVAATCGNLEITKILVQEKAVLDIKDDKDFTPLMCALYKGHIPVAHFLLDSGADAKLKTKQGSACLHYAFHCPCDEKNQFEFMWLLEKILDQGLDVNDMNDQSETPLHLAVIKKKDIGVYMLLQKKANPNVKNKSGYTPLHVAVMLGQLEITKLLCAFGAEKGNCAEVAKNKDIIAFLNDPKPKQLGPEWPRLDAKFANWKEQQKNKSAGEVILAVKQNSPSLVSNLLASGANINESDSDLRTPLHFAVSSENLPLVELLIKSGADPNACDIQGFTPLLSAASIGNLKVVEVLILAGGNVSAKNNQGTGVLHYVAKSKYTLESQEDLVRVLYLCLQRGATVTARNHPGETPLHEAALSKELPVVFLLKHGASTNSQSKKGLTPLHFAIKRETQNQVKLLLSDFEMDYFRDEIDELVAKAKTKDTLLKILNGPKTVAKTFKEYEAYINTQIEAIEKDKKIKTKLLSYASFNSDFIAAVASNDLALVKDLLRKGANVNERDPTTQNSALFIAVEKLYKDLVVFLLKQGADPNIPNSHHSTPLHFVVNHGIFDLVELLLTNGADPNFRDETGWTPLFHAANQSHYQVIELLLKSGTAVAFGQRPGLPSALHYLVRCKSDTPEDLQSFLRVLQLTVNQVTKKRADPKKALEDFMNLTNKQLETALHSAITKKSEWGAFFCIENGTNLNTKNSSGFTPLHLAIMTGMVGTVEMLLASGADVNLPCDKGKCIDLVPGPAKEQMVPLLTNPPTTSQLLQERKNKMAEILADGNR